MEISAKQSALLESPPRHIASGLLLRLLVLSAIGAAVLWQPWATPLDPRDRQHFYDRHYWQCAFDSISAATGCGLLTQRNWYSPAGRWVLTAIGVVGAVFYLHAAWRATTALRARIGNPGGSGVSFSGVLRAFLLVQILGLGIGAAAQFGGSSSEVDRDATKVEWMRTGLAAASGVALPTAAGPSSPRWVAGALGLLAAIGIPICLALGFANRGGVLRAIIGYAAFLALAAALIVTLEAPGQRGAREAIDDKLLSKGATLERFERAAAQAVAISGAGLPTEPLNERSLSAGSKFVLGGLLIVGGLGGGPTGGVGWSLLTLALLAACGRTNPARGANSAHPNAICCVRAAARIAVWMPLLTAIVALGLLAIQRQTASSFDLPVDFADAWVDAASVVNGGGLTTGLVEHVTSSRLSRGLGLPVDLYQYGMVWLMLALVVGRVAPVWIMQSAAKRPISSMPPGDSPVL